MTALRLGSLFDGIGVFPLAAVRCGIEPVWASEIEKAPISITKRHFPDMAHLGDVTKLDGRDLPPVHIITFGSPCQNLSQIGNRKGLAGEKSSLFFQAIRIIREMREATNGLFPAIAVWENVIYVLKCIRDVMSCKQMPLFFKMGYTKAKLWSVIPFAVVMLLVVLPSFVSALSGILDFAQSHKELFAFACILTSCIIQFVSYHIAVIFYRKQR